MLTVYLDDDSVDHVLIGLLRKAGHRVTIPSETQTSGASDSRHFLAAIERRLILITRNHEDYADLHRIVVAAGGVHPGILVVRFDNDPTRDLTPRGVVRAMARLATTGLPFSNEMYILNHWR